MVEDGGLWQRRNGKQSNFGFGIYKGVFGMTRREEIVNNIGYKITKAAVEYYQANCANDVDLSEAFEEGAKWMQETMIKKACQWILNNMHKYIKVKGFEIFVNNEDMANDFKQAMEE